MAQQLGRGRRSFSHELVFAIEEQHAGLASSSMAYACARATTSCSSRERSCRAA
jgi:hypothetical protein